MRLGNNIPNTRHRFTARKVHVRYDDPRVGKPQNIVGFENVAEAEDWLDKLIANSDVHPELFSIRGVKIA